MTNRVITNPAPVIAVINSTHDVIDLLRVAHQRAGFVVVTALTEELRDGRVDIERFIAQHQPRVILYDVAPPYEPNWHLFQHIAQMPVMAGRQFVITSTNPRHVERLAGPQEHVYEVVGKPEDIGRIVNAAREAAKIRPSR
jgi:CheY-like chemotaxis protein